MSLATPLLRSTLHHFLAWSRCTQIHTVSQLIYYTDNVINNYVLVSLCYLCCQHVRTPSMGPHAHSRADNSWFSLTSREGHRKQAAAEDTFHLSNLGLSSTQSEADQNREAEPCVSYSHLLQGKYHLLISYLERQPSSCIMSTWAYSAKRNLG